MRLALTIQNVELTFLIKDVPTLGQTLDLISRYTHRMNQSIRDGQHKDAVVTEELLRAASEVRLTNDEEIGSDNWIKTAAGYDITSGLRWDEVLQAYRKPWLGELGELP